MMPLRRAAGAHEFLDRPVHVADRDASLRDIDRLNAWFGGYWLTLRTLRRLAARRPGPRRPLLVVDVGGGRGDFARRAVARGVRRSRRVRVVVVDRDGALLARAAPEPDVLAVRADATALPFRAASIDVAVASLTLHHLEPAAAARCLGEMRAAARLGVIVNDLLRTRLTLALVWLATRVVARHRFSRHDGPLSVRRAYDAEELRVLAEQAGIPRLAVRRYRLLGRLLAVAA